MKTKIINTQNPLQALLAALALTSLLTCKQQSTTPQNQTVATDGHSLIIETFSEFPSDIVGCACYFSNDSAEFMEYKYIYVSDLDKLSYMKLNGSMVQFTKVDFQIIDNHTFHTVAKNTESGITMEIIEKLTEITDEEYARKRGTIKLTDHKGNSITKSFFGECGC